MTQRTPSPLFTLAALETYRHPCDTPGCSGAAASTDHLLCVDCAEGERLRWHCGDDEGDTLIARARWGNDCPRRRGRRMARWPPVALTPRRHTMPQTNTSPIAEAIRAARGGR